MIEIIPPSPDTLTPITLKVFVSGCVQSTKLVKNNPFYTAEITFQPGCFATPPARDYLFPLGKLTAGNYTAQVRHITTHGTGSSSIVDSKAFTVSAANTPRSIPTLDASAFIILSLTLVLVATVFGRKYAF